MVTDGKSEEFPLLVAPSGRNGESKKELARGSFEATCRPSASPTPCKRAASKHNPVKRGVAERGSGARALEGIESATATREI